MKKLFFILLVLSSCKKNPPSTIAIQIKETGGNTPVSNASVSLRRCANLGCAFGLVTEYSGTTDANGVCNVPQDKWDKIPVWNDAMLVSKIGYWSALYSKATSVDVIPLGWVRLRITRATNYPPSTYLDIQITPQTFSGTALGGGTTSYQFNAAADSSVLITAFGSQSTKIDWRVISAGNVINNGTWNQAVPRQDTVSTVLHY